MPCTHAVCSHHGIFAALDFIWLSVLMGDFYKAHLGTLARGSGADFDPLWWAALLVYACSWSG